jgi:predicted metal-dependent HD superfamily phosphohydrolase
VSASTFWDEGTRANAVAPRGAVTRDGATGTVGSMRVSSDVEIVHRWFERCHASGVALVAANEMGDRLAASYSEPGRHYHDLGHVRHVLDLAAGLRLDDTEREIVDFTLWFHDAILDPGRDDNETRSAELARSWLREQQLHCADEVADLIEMTAGHHVVDPARRPAAVVHDVDLAILGAIDHEYDRYVDAIRREYAHLDDQAFRSGRRSVLESFRAMDPIFVTAELAPVLELRARANISRELDQLRIVAS